MIVYLIKYIFGGFLRLAGVRYTCIVQCSQRLGNDFLVKARLSTDIMHNAYNYSHIDVNKSKAGALHDSQQRHRERHSSGGVSGEAEGAEFIRAANEWK